jgi:hypothetical protein
VDVGAGVDFPPLGGDVFGGDVLAGDVLAGDDVVTLGAGPFEVGEFALGVLVDVVLEVVDGSGVPVVVVVSVVDVVTGVGSVLLVGDPVAEPVPTGWVVFGPLAVGTAVGTVVGAPGAVASTPTQ